LGRTIAVSSGQALTLGRHNGCDVVVDDEAASRGHCSLTAHDDVCALADLRSANGTFVNERRVVAAELNRGDKVRIGSTVLELIDREVREPASRATHNPPPLTHG